MAYGYQCIVLHAHLPYVRHPEYDSFLEENWLFEAITETYVPLLHMLKRLHGAGLKNCLTLSLSPTLMSMLRDPFLQQRYLKHLEKLLRLADEEVKRTRGDADFAPLARLYQQRLTEVEHTYKESCGQDLLAAFVDYAEQGVLELMTCAATHGYLPLLRQEASSVRAQLKAGADSFQTMTGLQAEGVWLPECGYYQGLEALVEEAGFRYFFLDAHGILNARPQPYYGVSAPIVCPNGIAAFGRDPATSRQVWSRDEGYPGDPHYRDFYRDIGFDLELDTIAPYILDGRTRIQTGFKYYRITGAGDEKQPYRPEQAVERVQIHADDFVERSCQALYAQGQRKDPAPIIVSPYDAELFGHWWFEGPDWLEAVITRMAGEAADVGLTTPSRYLQENPRQQVALPADSSWGDGGYNAFWLNPGNDWVYPYLHDAAQRMHMLAQIYGDEPEGSQRYRALQQAGRSLLLAQASDWAFIMKTETSKEYAYNRTRDHLARFNYLEHAVRSGEFDERQLQALEVMDPIFPQLSPRIFS